MDVGTETFGFNQNLEGLLEDNTTYYITVKAVNSAGLVTINSSQGKTPLTTDLHSVWFDGVMCNMVVCHRSVVIFLQPHANKPLKYCKNLVSTGFSFAAAMRIPVVLELVCVYLHF